MENETDKKEKLGLFKRLGIAIAKPKDYEKLADEKTGRTIGTFILISLVQTICICAFLFYIGNVLLTALNQWISEFPEFSFSKSGFESNMEEPFVYYDDDLTIYVNVDDNKTIKEIKEENSDKIYATVDYIILGKDGVVAKNDGELETFIFADNLNEQTFNKTNVIEFCNKYLVNKMLAIVVVITGIFIWIFVAIFKFIGGLIYGLIGMAIASIQGKDIKFGKLYNIAMYAGVTTTIIGLFDLFVYPIPFWGTLKIVIICLYMGFGIKYIDVKDNNNGIDNNDNNSFGNKIEDNGNEEFKNNLEEDNNNEENK